MAVKDAIFEKMIEAWEVGFERFPDHEKEIDIVDHGDGGKWVMVNGRAFDMCRRCVDVFGTRWVSEGFTHVVCPDGSEFAIEWRNLVELVKEVQGSSLQLKIF